MSHYTRRKTSWLSRAVRRRCRSGNLDGRETGHLWRNRILNDAIITDVAYSPTRNLLAVGNNEGAVEVWNVSDPSNIGQRRETSIGNPIRHLAFNPEETRLLLMGDFASDSTKSQRV